MMGAALRGTGDEALQLCFTRGHGRDQLGHSWSFSGDADRMRAAGFSSQAGHAGNAAERYPILQDDVEQSYWLAHLVAIVRVGLVVI
jgi:hypothetical protein